MFLVLVYVLPFWIFKYFPSQDGPCHIYNSFIIRHYNDPDYVFNQYYDIRKSPIPNWASHASMMLLMYLVSPPMAERILLTGYVILMALSMLYLVNNVQSGRTPLVFIGLPFAYNYLFLMGFYNFSLSVALLMLAIGYCWKHFDTLGVKNAIVLALLLIVLYFCHLVPLVLAFFSISAIAILRLLPRFTRWKQTLLSFLCMLPSAGLTFYYTHTRGTKQTPGSWELKRLWEYFFHNESLAYHSKSQITFGRIITWAFVALFCYTFIRDRFFTKEWRLSLRVHWKDFFLLLCIAFFVIYLKAPDGMSGGGFIKTRLALLPFLIIIPWLSWDMPKLARAIVGSLLALLSVAYIIHASYYHKLLNDDMKIYTSGYHVIEKNKVVLPLAFDRIGKGWRIGAFLHSVGHYGYTTGCIEMDNYEATTAYFPTVYKPNLRIPPLATTEGNPGAVDFAAYADYIDYIITWGLVSGSKVEKKILEYYELVEGNGNLKIYRRRNKTRYSYKEWDNENLCRN